MANSYETMYIIRPDSSEEQVNQVTEKYIEFIKERGAVDIKIQNRGKRRLAYEVKNFLDGIYIQMNYKSDGQHVKPMERDMRLSEQVIRYLTLKLTTDEPEAEQEEEVVDVVDVPSQPEPPQEQPPQVEVSEEQPPQVEVSEEQPPQEQPG